jgi:hypothetical protein
MAHPRSGSGSPLHTSISMLPIIFHFHQRLVSHWLVDTRPFPFAPHAHVRLGSFVRSFVSQDPSSGEGVNFSSAVQTCYKTLARRVVSWCVVVVILLGSSDPRPRPGSCRPPNAHARFEPSGACAVVALDSTVHCLAKKKGVLELLGFTAQQPLSRS